jgi:hypothetical protein
MYGAGTARAAAEKLGAQQDGMLISDILCSCQNVASQSHHICISLPRVFAVEAYRHDIARATHVYHENLPAKAH